MCPRLHILRTGGCKYKGADFLQSEELGRNIALVNQTSEVHDGSRSECQHSHLHRSGLHNVGSAVALPLVPNVTHTPGSPMAGRGLGSQKGL